MMPGEQHGSRLEGRRLVLLRALWASASVAFIVLFVAGIFQDVPAARQDASRWREMGLAAYYLLLALFIFWRRSDDWVAAILSLTFMMALSTDNVQVIFGSSPAVQRLELVLGAVSSALLLCVFYVFPDGRFVPRWTRWAAAGQVGIQIWRIFFEPAYMARGFALIGLLFVTAPVAQVYRFFRTPDRAQRQQIKWIVFGLAVTVPPLGAALILSDPSGWFDSRTVEQVGLFLWMAFLLILPLSITISILRYRLWDIDVIIRKTLQYTVLSALLALIYFGSVVLLQTFFGSLAGERSPLIIVLSTLVIAVLFSPLRRRVQEAVDRRFYRRKVDAVAALSAFAVVARDETDIGVLTGQFVNVVQETMEPKSVSVWLRTAVPGTSAAGKGKGRP